MSTFVELAESQTCSVLSYLPSRHMLAQASCEVVDDSSANLQRSQGPAWACLARRSNKAQPAKIVAWRICQAVCGADVVEILSARKKLSAMSLSVPNHEPAMSWRQAHTMTSSGNCETSTWDCCRLPTWICREACVTKIVLYIQYWSFSQLWGLRIVKLLRCTTATRRIHTYLVLHCDI